MSHTEDRVAQLEDLYARRLLPRAQFIRALGALGLSLGALERVFGSDAQEALAAGASVPQYVVLITLDAFRPDYLSLAKMPALQALRTSGTVYDRAWVAQLQSQTPASHASISTGVTPAKHGILGFEWREGTKEILDGWAAGVIAGTMDAQLRRSGTNSISMAVKAADSKARVIAVSSEKVYAADGMGGWAADYVFYHYRDVAHHRLTPQALIGHRATPPKFLKRARLTGTYPLKHWSTWDYLSSELAVAAMQAFRPKVLMINFPGVDAFGHPYGGPAAPDIMGAIAAGIDRGIDRVVQAYKHAGIFDKTLFVVASDHGMVPNDRMIKGEDMTAALKGAGATPMFQTGGTARFQYLTEPRKALATAQALAHVPNVASAYHLVKSGGTYSYERAAGTVLDPMLNDANRYLLHTFVGPRAPDVVGVFRENTIGQVINRAYGYHGGLDWGSQHTLLSFTGPSVLPGTISHFPARLIDIAPTILRLLGLPHARMDGVPLADSITSATPNELKAQSAVSPSLTAYQNALVAQAESNAEEDARLNIHHPPVHMGKP